MTDRGRPLRELLIRSGGQTGVDRAALDAAIAAGLAYAGWCPKGGIAEDLPEPPGLRARYPSLVETPLSDPKQRTAWNARDSHATLILAAGGAADVSPGTAWTRRCAETWKKPLMIADVADSPDVARTSEWITGTAGGRDAPLDLNIAGPRESEAPGIYTLSYDFLAALFASLAAG